MAKRPWFRSSRAYGSVPVSPMGWFATLLLVSIEFAGAFLLILMPQALRQPIGWDRALGWFLLSAGTIAFFIMLSYARMDEAEGSDVPRG